MINILLKLDTKKSEKERLIYERGSIYGNFFSLSPKDWKSTLSIEVFGRKDISIKISADINTTGQWVIKKEHDFLENEFNRIENILSNKNKNRKYEYSGNFPKPADKKNAYEIPKSAKIKSVDKRSQTKNFQIFILFVGLFILLGIFLTFTPSIGIIISILVGSIVVGIPTLILINLLFSSINLLTSNKGKKLFTLLRVFFVSIPLFLWMMGGIGFFGSALSAEGGLNWLPSSFEWPVGHTDNAARTNDGYYVVPHEPSGRIQIYDSNLKFLRWWHVENGGGILKISTTEDNLINVYAARRNCHYIFNLQGDIILKEEYDSDQYPFSSIPDSNLSLDIPTNIFLLPLSHPVISWFCIVIGFVFLGLGFHIIDLYEKNK